MQRAPWTTCPGAVAVLEQTFTGIALESFAARGEKRANCTHLHDLAVLAAAHAFDAAATVFDILVSDPIEGRSEAELRRNGIAVLGWSVVKGRIVEPAPLAGLDLDNMRPWIESLDPAAAGGGKAAALGNHGRARANACRRMGIRDRPHGKSAAGVTRSSRTRSGEAKHVGAIRDFSRGRRGRSSRASARTDRTRIYFMSRAITRRAGLPEGGHHEDERYGGHQRR